MSYTAHASGFVLLLLPLGRKGPGRSCPGPFFLSGLTLRDGMRRDKIAVAMRKLEYVNRLYAHKGPFHP